MRTHRGWPGKRVGPAEDRCRILRAGPTVHVRQLRLVTVTTARNALELSCTSDVNAQRAADRKSHALTTSDEMRVILAIENNTPVVDSEQYQQPPPPRPPL